MHNLYKATQLSGVDTNRFGTLIILSTHISVGIATGYGLDDLMIGVQFPGGAGNFSLRHHFQTGSDAYLASYPMGTGGYFPGDKAAGV
jgi:hypothetical protein